MDTTSQFPAGTIGNWLLESKFKISPHALGFQKELFPDGAA